MIHSHLISGWHGWIQNDQNLDDFCSEGDIRVGDVGVIQIQAGANRNHNALFAAAVASALRARLREIAVIAMRDDVESDDLDVDSLLLRLNDACSEDRIPFHVDVQTLCNSEIEVSNRIGEMSRATTDLTQHLFCFAHNGCLAERLRFGAEAGLQAASSSNLVRVHILYEPNTASIGEFLSWARSAFMRKVSGVRWQEKRSNGKLYEVIHGFKLRYEKSLIQQR